MSTLKRRIKAIRLGSLSLILFAIGLLALVTFWLKVSMNATQDNISSISDPHLDKQYVSEMDESLKLKPSLASQANFMGTDSQGYSQPLARSDSYQDDSYEDESYDDKEQVMGLPLTEYADTVERSDGKALRDLLATFWMECEARENCDYLLKLLGSLLNKQDYRLIAGYRRLEQERQTLMGLEVTSHDASLGEKVAQVKYVDAQIWGATAERLFADQYHQYELRLASFELEQIADGLQYVEQYNQLIAEQIVSSEDVNSSASNADDNKGISELVAYEQAIAWLPQDMSAAERSKAQALLAGQYLSAEQSAAIKAREIEVEVQGAMVRDYQTELNKLKAELSSLRATSHASMSQVEWATYYDSQVLQFRVSFFNG